MSSLPAAADVAIDAQGLTKVFVARVAGDGPLRGWPRRLPQRTVAAVDGVTFQVRRGELVGLLGPNGAGKTTLLRLLATLLTPTAGAARVWGYDVRTDGARVRRHVGVVFGGEKAVYGRLTGRENLEYAAALYGLPRARARERTSALLELVGLASRADDLAERYSTGMRQRLALARALVHDPPVLLLDEPTAGLDPQGARAVRDLIRQLHAAGKTIVLATHRMDEADQLGERIAIIHRGRIVALDTPPALKRSLGRDPVLSVEVDGPGDLEGVVRSLPGVRRVWRDGAGTEGACRILLQADDPATAVSELAAAIARGGGRVRRLQTVEASLEDVFLALTGRRLRDGEPAASL